MLLTAFRDILLTADPASTHYFGSGSGDYTIWTEYDEEASGADDKREKLFDRIQVDRYTKTEYDPMVNTIKETLDAAGIVYFYRVYAEVETGYIHHIWDCEVW